MIRNAIARLLESEDLGRDEMIRVMDEIMSGECTDAQIGGFLIALRMKGETVDEISGAAEVMRQKATRVEAPEGVIDTCGTGGDGQHTFNVSTCSAIVAAGAGAKVAKHGNRSVSSSSGSSQVLEELGVNLALSPKGVARCIREAGIGFLYAPALHGAMKYAIGPRKELAVRTVFNLLGPLTNPAGARRQLVGVYASSLAETLAHVLNKLGAVRALVVHGHDGLDEISISDETTVAFLSEGEVQSMVIAPEDFGLERAPVESLRVESQEESAAIVRAVLSGEIGPARDIVLLNAGAALYVAGLADDIAEGVEKAAESIGTCAAQKTLDALVRTSNDE